MRVFLSRPRIFSGPPGSIFLARVCPRETPHVDVVRSWLLWTARIDLFSSRLSSGGPPLGWAGELAFWTTRIDRASCRPRIFSAVGLCAAQCLSWSCLSLGDPPLGWVGEWASWTTWIDLFSSRVSSGDPPLGCGGELVALDRQNRPF